ncbi:hypothetical protein INR49_006686 [Caranx melampygus]|nr:hypothetical protein INR49_006686 [Caranx melampygus]
MTMTRSDMFSAVFAAPCGATSRDSPVVTKMNTAFKVYNLQSSAVVFVITSVSSLSWYLLMELGEQ